MKLASNAPASPPQGRFAGIYYHLAACHNIRRWIRRGGMPHLRGRTMGEACQHSPAVAAKLLISWMKPDRLHCVVNRRLTIAPHTLAVEDLSERLEGRHARHIGNGTDADGIWADHGSVPL